MDEGASVPDMLFSILRFFAHESCGQCAPCRIGSKQLLDMIYDIRQGRGNEQDLGLMITVAEAMFQASLCPLGQSPVMPVKSAIEHFRNEFVAAVSKIN